MDMLDQHNFSPTSRTLITGAAFIVIILGLRAMAFFCNAAFLALVITITFMPLVKKLKLRGWPNAIAAGLVILVALGLVAAIMLLMVYSAQQLINTLPTLQGPLTQQTSDLNMVLSKYHIDAANFTADVQKLILGSLSRASSALASIGQLMAIFGMAILASAFMLFEADTFSSQLGRKFGNDSPIAVNFTRFMQGTRDFLLVTTILGLLQGALIAFALWLLGVPLAIVWGVVFWLLNYIPYVGFWLAMLPPAFLAGITMGWEYGLLVVVIYMIISNVFKLLVMPKVMGDKVDTSMTVGFLGLFFWGFVFGALGMLLAYPYTLLVRDVMLTSTNEFWLVDLMHKGSAGPENPGA
jgi:AI-2 transport protein TqsA